MLVCLCEGSFFYQTEQKVLCGISKFNHCKWHWDKNNFKIFSLFNSFEKFHCIYFRDKLFIVFFVSRRFWLKFNLQLSNHSWQSIKFYRNWHISFAHKNTGRIDFRMKRIDWKSAKFEQTNGFVFILVLETKASLELSFLLTWKSWINYNTNS